MIDRATILDLASALYNQTHAFAPMERFPETCRLCSRDRDANASALSDAHNAHDLALKVLTGLQVVLW